jgi:hypothetical protein
MAVEQSADELKSPLLSALDGVRAGRPNDAAELLAQAHVDYEKVHDGFRNANARLLDELHRTQGQVVADYVSGSVYDELMAFYLGDSPHPSFRDHVTRFAMHWHWHRTLFRLVEHPDRVTFHLEPCGSGGRLINEGAYYKGAERPFSLISTPSPATFGEANFPSWCAHCADSNRSFPNVGSI